MQNFFYVCFIEKLLVIKKIIARQVKDNKSTLPAAFQQDKQTTVLLSGNL